jgi:1,2-diacylglycerol 3-alpha-glucosyltransferase
MKVALVSTGLDRIKRGFESFTESLFHALRTYAPDVDVTLFQGGGNGADRRIVVRNLHRANIPARWLSGHKASLLEERSFALSFYPMLRRGRYDIVQYNELPMGSALFHLRRWFGGKFKLLYVNGAPSPPIHYHHRCDFAQILTGPAYEEAREFGIPDNRLFLLPYGVDARRFSPRVRTLRSQIRKQLGIPEDVTVVLTVAALKCEHKRLDYLIREVSSINGPIWLLAAGQRTNETALLEQEADRRLAGRWRFVTWPHEILHNLYGAADIFVLSSLTEAFGIVTVEAMLSGLPVLVHKSEVNNWITNGTPVQLIDMSFEGQLAKAIGTFLSNGAHGSSRNAAKMRFSWEKSVAKYIDVYRRIIVDAKKDELVKDTQAYGNYEEITF